MKTIIHKAATRGHANHGWLESYHSFSFANYYNPERMNFGKLRVLNDDTVAPKMGFGTHPHQNMEIISIPLQGALTHKDTMGNKQDITVGEVQVMSAGTGLQHSEFNDSKTEEVKFLQLWIQPNEINVVPRYEQKKFNEAKNALQTLVSPQNATVEESLWIHQDAYIIKGTFEKGIKQEYTVKNKGNGIYILVLDGNLQIGDIGLQSKDALGITEVEQIELESITNTTFLIIEVPMT